MEELMDNRKITKDAIKVEVLTHYGNGILACVKCGFSDVRGLCIDHIHGGGTKHFKELHRYGNSFYKWLKDNGYPTGFQTLCCNCNMIKRSTDNEHRWRKVTIEEMKRDYTNYFHRA